jgi:hypothetical protein
MQALVLCCIRSVPRACNERRAAVIEAHDTQLLLCGFGSLGGVEACDWLKQVIGFGRLLQNRVSLSVKDHSV